MARIAGVDLPNEKRIEAGLTYIYGIGWSTSREILEKTGIDSSTRVKDLTEEEVDNFMEDFTIPSKLLQLVYIDEKNPCPTFKFKEMPSMSPSTGGIIFDDICYDVINGTKENNLNEEFND